ncbi:hypothetical protein V5799_031888 [Amblyomma americanum]|uniref:RING-type domain-containing protein n=1 Tax=Amblyomma americanum TaxID=6943 RepID=A0AAQ4DSR3_AMBAM
MADGSAMDGFVVKLNGFDDFLDGKTIHFVGSFPTGNICVCCGDLHSSIKLSMCLHAFCPTCSERIVNAGTHCPVDGLPVSFENLAVSDLDESVVADCTVRCLNLQYGCAFEGRLRDIEQHVLQHCLHNPVSCWRCKRLMTLSQYADHRVECHRRARVQARFSESYPRTGLKEKGGVADGINESLVSTSESVESALKPSLPVEVVPGEFNDSGNAGPKDQTHLVSRKGPVPTSTGFPRLTSHRPLLVRQPHHVKSLESDAAAASVEGPVFPASSGEKASEDDGSSSATFGVGSTDRTQVSQGRKSPVRPKTLSLGLRRTPKLTAAELNAALGITSQVSRPKDRTPVTDDTLTSLSQSFQNLTCKTSDASITQPGECDQHFVEGIARVSIHSPERPAAARVRTLSEVEAEGKDSEHEEGSAELSAMSAKCDADASGNTAAAVSSGATSNPGQSREESPPLSALREMYRFHNVTFTFSDVAGVRSTLKRNNEVVMLSEKGVLHGYTFRATCRFRGLDGLTLLSFGLFFCSGEYDQWCAWPFEMSVFLEVVHPRKDARNMRVQLRPSRAEAASAFRKPDPGSVNPGFVSQDYAWNSVVRAGFLVENALHVVVTFK